MEPLSVGASSTVQYESLLATESVEVIDLTFSGFFGGLEGFGGAAAAAALLLLLLLLVVPLASTTTASASGGTCFTSAAASAAVSLVPAVAELVCTLWMSPALPMLVA